MLLAKRQKQIPERLSHYTGIEALKSILSDKEGKGICFWAFSNRSKNDDQEIMMGEYMLNRVLEVLPSSGFSLLKHFGGYENSASISFMEGEVNQHMLKEYGCFRLEFDLRNLGIGIFTEGLVDCEYVANKELKEYADEYCEMIDKKYCSIIDIQKKYGKSSPFVLSYIEENIEMEIDIMQKVFCLKEKKWSEEMEWRKVFKLKKDDSNVHFLEEKPYIKYYFDKELLTGISIFCSDVSLDTAKKDADDILDYISERGYKARVEIKNIDN